MVKGKIVIAVLALILFFLLVGFVRNLFQIPDDKVKYILWYIRVEERRKNPYNLGELPSFSAGMGNNL